MAGEISGDDEDEDEAITRQSEGERYCAATKRRVRDDAKLVCGDC